MTSAPGRAGRVAGALTALAMMVVPVLPAGASPPGALPAAGPTAGATAAAPAIELVRQPAWVRPGEPYQVEVRLTDVPAGAQLTLVVHDRLQSREQFRTTLAGDLGGEEHRVAPQPLAAVPGAPSATVTTTIGFTPGEAGTGLSGQGVYPVEVQVLSADGVAVAGLVTYLSFLKEATPDLTPLQVAVIVDIGAGPALQADGRIVLPAGAVDRARERARVLNQTLRAGVDLTLAPRPETLEALAVSPGLGARTVADIRTGRTGRRVIARPFVDVDLTALERDGLVGEANHQAEGGAEVVRERLGVEPVGRIWLSGPTLGAPGARLAADLGFARAVVPPSATTGGAATEPAADGAGGAPAETPAVPMTPVRLGEDGPQTMVSDPALAAHLTSQDGMIAAHRFIAELAITWLEAPSNLRAVVVHVPADAPLDTDLVSAALGALADGQAAEVVPLEHVFRDVTPLPDGPATIEPAAHVGDDRLAAIAPSLEIAREGGTGVGSALDDDLLGVSLDHSLLLATGTDTPDEQRAAYVDRVLGAAGELAQAVRLNDEFRITLTSRSSTLPVTLENVSDESVTVRIGLEGDQLEFPEGDVIRDVELAPGTTRVEVPVRVRTSGSFTVDITVTSPDGALVFDTTTFDVRSTVISGVGLVLSAGAGLFLAVWWARHWRRSRRSRHLAPAGAAAPSGPGGDGGPPGGAGAARGDRAPGAASRAGAGAAHMARQRSRSG